MTSILGRLSRRLSGPKADVRRDDSRRPEVDDRRQSRSTRVELHRSPRSPAASPRQATWASAKQHALLLVLWLRERGLVDGTILPGDLRREYELMCGQWRVLVRGHNWVAREYTLLTSDGLKLYAPTPDGRRVRVHRLPTSSSVAQSAADGHRAQLAA
jgi:hypothetical protein